MARRRQGSGASAYRSHAESLGQAVRRGFVPGRPLHDPTRLLRVAVGMLTATVATMFIHDEIARLLLIVGAFLGAIACLMPHLRPRVESAAGTGVAMACAAYAGSLLGDRWGVVFPLMALGFFLAGVLRAVAIGAAMRTLVVVIIFTAFCEIAPGLPVSATTITRGFGLGVVIMVLAQLLPPHEGRHAAQRHAISELYRAVAERGSTLQPLLTAQRSVALAHLRRKHSRRGQYAALVSLAEQVDDVLALLDEQRPTSCSAWHDVAARRLQAIADGVERRIAPGATASGEAWPADGASPTERRLAKLVEHAERVSRGEDVNVATARRAPSAVEMLRDEIGVPSSPFFQHGLRLAVTAVASMALGLWMGRHLPATIAMPGHGFWVVVAATLIMFPDYGATFARGVGRTAGSAVGALLGIVVAALDLPTTAHAWVLFALFLGYLAFRSCGQPYTMFFVVAWIAGLSPGFSGAVTRSFDTLVGCLFAFALFLLTPTWHSTRLQAAFERAAKTQAERLRALDAVWQAPSEDASRALAHATTASHLALTDLTTTAHSAAMEPTHHHDAWTPEATSEAVSAVMSVSRTVGAVSMLAPGTHRARPHEVQQALDSAAFDGPRAVIDSCDVAVQQLRNAADLTPVAR